MRLQQALAGILMAAAMLVFSAPALAGGWAVVHLDEQPGEVVAGEPWRFGFMVLQHDVTPNSDVTPVVRAIHKETSKEIMATGTQQGKTGHFVAEVTFPLAGEWKWLIHPEPYAETSFATLDVLTSPDANSYRANLLTGSCAEAGKVAFPLGIVETQTLPMKTSQLPLGVAVSTIDTPLPELLATAHAIGIGAGERDSVPSAIACGDIGGTAVESASEVVLGLQDEVSARNVGVAVLRDAGERTTVSLYLLEMGSPGAADTVASGAEKTIDILDAFVFAPFSIEAAPGDTITWVNRSAASHTVTGDDLAFDDSGPIAPGESFSLTFDAPGTYAYHCGPHPGMVGQIVVA
ncbi:MAG: cupredoxin family copper-binding protein [Chloroflexia bacterium]|nr:cupredoxin family copper-binding protein [Chloroflexia bacterium]